MAAHFEPVVNANYKLVAPTPTRRTAIGGYPKVASYDMLGEQLRYSNPVKHGCLHSFVANVGPLLSGDELSRLSWVRLNRLRTGIGRFGSLIHRWGLTTTAVCDCGAERQTPEHLLYQCPIYELARKDGLLILDDNTID